MYTLILVDYNSIENTVSYALCCGQTLGISRVVIVENGENQPQLLQACFGIPEPINAAQRDALRFYKDGLDVIYCHSGGNLGYATGNNIGALIAREIWSDPYYIISNNDLRFPRGVDLSVVQTMFEENPRIGIIGPLVTTPEGEVQSPRENKTAFQRLVLQTWIHASGVFLPPHVQQKLVDKYIADALQDVPTGQYDWVSGCFFVVRADMFHQAGMFDEATFLYGEEMILAKRLEAVGSQVWFCREMEVVHHHAQTTKAKFSEIKMYEMTFQSMCHYFKTYAGTSQVLITLAKWNFALYKALFYGWQKVKKIAKRG